MSNKVTIKNNQNSRRGFLKDITKWVGGTTLLSAAANIITSSKINAAGTTDSIQASGTPLIGSIDMVGFNFAPVGWAQCSGQLMAISENDALFALIGTIYGGDGQTTFALPDLRGRAPMHMGQGPGLSSCTIGQRAGQETVTLTVNEIPSHNHSLAVNSAGGNSDNPGSNFIASNSEGIKHYSDTGGSSANGASIGNAGNSQPHNNMPPYLVVNFIIALYGIFPSRN